MAQQTINVGAAPNDGTGTPLRTAFQYTNSNFSELYTATGPSGNNITVPGTATISGDLTVRTNRLATTTTGVGIGTASPIVPLDVRGGAGAGALFLRTTDPTAPVSSAYIQTPVSTGFSSTVPVYGFWYQNSGMGNPANDTLNWIIASGEQMRLNATGLGVGGSPNDKLEVVGSGSAGIRVSRAGVSSQYTTLSAGATGPSLDASSAIGVLTFGVAGSTKMTVDTSGNVGIGVTPSAWATYKAVSVGGIGASVFGLGSSQTGVAQGAYFNNGAGSGWAYSATSQVPTYYLQINGENIWNVAASGTAGAQIAAWTPAMKLDASGNLLVGTTTASGRVAVDTDLTTYNGMSVKNTGTVYGSSAFFFRFINSSGATAGSIQHTAVTTTNYSTTSDARLKESKGISTDTSVIDNTVVHDFVWKADGSTDRGVFAQEAHAVKPRAVSVGSDELTEDGNIKTPWSVDYSKFVPDLIVYCQQLKKQVVELAAEVNALKNA